jgi:hypothetical protein
MVLSEKGIGCARESGFTEGGESSGTFGRRPPLCPNSVLVLPSVMPGRFWKTAEDSTKLLMRS